jgi:hypothetical protein
VTTDAGNGTAFDAALQADPAYIRAKKLWPTTTLLGNGEGHTRIGRMYYGRSRDWSATSNKGRLYFHPADYPVQVWAVSITPAGIEWFDTELLRITERNVTVRYAGEVARLDRDMLWRAWTFYRKVMFVSSRTGRIAALLDQFWLDQYAGRAGFAPPPAMQMALVQAIQILGVPLDYTHEDVVAAFRRAVKRAHPDVGGTAEMFRLFVEARDRLLAAIGTKEKAPKPPSYAPSGMIIRYGRYRPSAQRRLGGARRSSIRAG